MIRKGFILLVLSFMCTLSFAQANQDAIALEKKIVKRAKMMNDSGVLISSMYRLVALEGEQSTYKDSLAYIYYSTRNYTSSFLMANEALNRDPSNQSLIEIKAISLESLGAIDKSLEAYQQLYALSKNNFHGYSVAKLQMGLKLNEEAYATIQEVEKLNDEGKYKVNFNINQSHQQQVELLAAIQYLKGLIEEDLDKKPEALASFQKAVKIQDDFILAKDKVDALSN